jgi:hypothetical protein
MRSRRFHAMILLDEPAISSTQRHQYALARHRRRVSPYGHAVGTPHIQLLAGEGVLFRNTFCAVPICPVVKRC